MSVIVKGMEMPECCYDCPFIRTSFAGDYYCAKGKGDEDDLKKLYSQRMADCPLVEIPAPHGRLIDATFEENHYASMLLDPTPDVTEQDKHKARIVIDALRMAKTVIEAEGEKDGR